MSMPLKKVGDDIRARIKAAQASGALPDHEPGGGYGYIRYEVRVTNGKGGVKPAVNITIGGYEWLIPDRADDGALARWLDTDGAALIAAVDGVAARDRFTSADGAVKLGGETEFGICIVSATPTGVRHETNA